MKQEKTESIFAERVKKLLKEHKVTQKALCEDLNIQQGSFSRYMRKGRTPRADTLADIANYLHTTSDFLTGRDDNLQNAFYLFAKDTKTASTEQNKELASILDGINKSIGY